MTPTSVLEMHDRGNLYDLSLPDVLGPSPSHGGGLRSPLFFGRRVADRAAQKRLRECIAFVFLA
jgi:hypothetical protein